MEFTVTESIDAPRDQVLAALADPDYYAHLGGALSAVRPPELLEVSEASGTVRTRVRYAFDGTISGPAARVVDAERLTWVIETSYDTGTHRGTVVVVPDHYRSMLRCRGTLTLEEAGGSTLETVAGRLEVKVPLLSGAAERAILGGFTRHLELEAAAMAEYCATPR